MLCTLSGISLLGMKYFVNDICGGLRNIPSHLTVADIHREYLLPATAICKTSFAEAFTNNLLLSSTTSSSDGVSPSATTALPSYSIEIDASSTATGSSPVLPLTAKSLLAESSRIRTSAVLVGFSWQDSFKDIMQTIFEFYDKHDEELQQQLYCWIDFFCMNYHHIAYDNMDQREMWIRELQDAYIHVGHCFVIVTNWHTSIATVLSNSILLMQIYICALGKFHFDVLMLSYVEEDLQHEIHAFMSLEMLQREDEEQARRKRGENFDHRSSIEVLQSIQEENNIEEVPETENADEQLDISGLSVTTLSSPLKAEIVSHQTLTFHKLFPHAPCLVQDMTQLDNCVSGPPGYAKHLLEDVLPYEEGQVRFCEYLATILDDWLRNFLIAMQQQPVLQINPSYSHDFRQSIEHDAIKMMKKVHLQVTQLMVSKRYDEAEKMLLGLFHEQKEFLKTQSSSASESYACSFELAHTMKVLIDLLLETKKFVLAEMMMISAVEHFRSMATLPLPTSTYSSASTVTSNSTAVHTPVSNISNGDGESVPFKATSLTSSSVALLYLESMQQLGYFYYVHKQHRKAITWLETYYQHVKDILGTKHMMTLQAMYMMSDVLREMDRFDEAMIYANSSYQLAREQLGMEHATTKSYYEQLQRIRQLQMMIPISSLSSAMGVVGQSSSSSSRSSRSSRHGKRSDDDAASDHSASSTCIIA